MASDAEYPLVLMSVRSGQEEAILSAGSRHARKEKYLT